VSFGVAGAGSEHPEKITDNETNKTAAIDFLICIRTEKEKAQERKFAFLCPSNLAGSPYVQL
jgi:hypothetical protein